MMASSDEAGDETPTATPAENPFSAAAAWDAVAPAVAPNPRALPAATIDEAVASHADVSEVEVDMPPRAMDPLGRASPLALRPARSDARLSV